MTSPRGGGVVAIDDTVLRLLRADGGAWGVQDLAARLDVPKATVSRSTDRLALRGHVTKSVDAIDKRRRVVRATSTLPPPQRTPRTAMAITDSWTADR